MGTNPHQLSKGAWHVECHLGLEVVDGATIILQVSPSPVAGTVVSETLEVAVDGRPLAVRRLGSDHGGVCQLLHSPPGVLTVDLLAAIEPTSRPEDPAVEVLDIEQLTYLRQSRYCPSDRLSRFVEHELGHVERGPQLLTAVVDWVSSRLTYEQGSSGPLDSAVDSLFAGRGVCRDFAHLAITVLRALDVPARLVAAYAPGLSPMDFHSVVEAHIDGHWWVLDPTRLAPRSSLLRISTGRDAADTAFLAVLGGEATLRLTEVVAFTEGDLPIDDHLGLVRLP